jgi:hypothetical protein
MAFKVTIGSPPYLDDLAAQLEVDYKGGVAIPFEMFREAGRLRLSVFPTGNDENWTFDVADLLEALGSAMARLGV